MKSLLVLLSKQLVYTKDTFTSPNMPNLRIDIPTSDFMRFGYNDYLSYIQFSLSLFRLQFFNSLNYNKKANPFTIEGIYSHLNLHSSNNYEQLTRNFCFHLRII